MLEAHPRVRQMSGRGIVVSVLPARTCINLRGDGLDARFARAVASVADVRPPLEPGASTAGLLASLLWLGPDEWLVVSETQAAGELYSRLQRALSGIDSAVTDVSDASFVYAVAGENSRGMLAKGCSVDLHPRVFAPGKCARTLLAKVGTLIHLRAADPVFELYFARSCGDYAWAWLEAAALEFLQPG